ncbi:hypothetical protein [Hoylesella nanceiensis]|jgi:hypothetical protein|uniref:hypothetical protein n=1 Tax=Hoylesella nanceiensis TaxID=425941 RepID=UPI0028E1B6C7|nr:hypothetical protein [Hoylesella nanceiensis]
MKNNEKNKTSLEIYVKNRELIDRVITLPASKFLTTHSSLFNACISSAPLCSAAYKVYEQLNASHTTFYSSISFLEIHQLIRRMEDYETLTNAIFNAVSTYQVPDVIDLSSLKHDMPPINSLKVLPLNTNLNPSELSILEWLIKDKRLLDWCKTHFPKLSKANMESVISYIFSKFITALFEKLIETFIKF